MNRQGQISEEMLNAFVDGEIDSEEKIELLRQLSGNPEMTQRVCQLIRTKELLRSAYRDTEIPAPEHRRQPATTHGTTIRKIGGAGALAASLLVGFILFSQPQEVGEVTVAKQSSQPSSFRQVAHQEAESEPLQIIFHLTSSNPLRIERRLDNVDLLLQHADQSGQTASIEVIANGEGLSLFREGASSFADRIHEMSRDNRNLSFIACQRTIDQLESGGEGKVRLLPDVIRAGSGISQVIQRQQQGWSYIQI